MTSPVLPTVLRGRLLMPGGSFVSGALHFGSHITALEDAPDEGGPLLLPGFVDTHVHGGGGGDAMDGAAGVRTMARLHAQHGTTTLLPTTMTNPWERVLAALRGVREVMDGGGVLGGADIPGAHLEGPFISPQRLGAQPACTLEPTSERLAEVLALGVVRAVTLAPEVAGATEAALELAEAGVRIGIGHTVADADTAAALLRAVHAAGGRTAGTHLFNAMGDIQGRNPGAAGAILADPHAFPELIFDGFHLHPLSLLLARAAAPNRVMLITDAMRAAGQGDGESELGGQTVTVRGGRATLAGGTLAGSVLTMDVALRNAVAAGIPLPEVSRMLSLHPAQSIGLLDRGELRVGWRADIVALNDDLQVQEVYVGGRRVPDLPSAK